MLPLQTPHPGGLELQPCQPKSRCLGWRVQTTKAQWSASLALAMAAGILSSAGRTQRNIWYVTLPGREKGMKSAGMFRRAWGQRWAEAGGSGGGITNCNPGAMTKSGESDPEWHLHEVT